MNPKITLFCAGLLLCSSAFASLPDPVYGFGSYSLGGQNYTVVSSDVGFGSAIIQTPHGDVNAGWFSTTHWNGLASDGVYVDVNYDGSGSAGTIKYFNPADGSWSSPAPITYSSIPFSPAPSGPAVPDMTGLMSVLISASISLVEAGIAALVILWGIPYLKGILRRAM